MKWGYLIVIVAVLATYFALPPIFNLVGLGIGTLFVVIFLFIIGLLLVLLGRKTKKAQAKK